MGDVEFVIPVPIHVHLRAGVIAKTLYQALKVGTDEIGAISRLPDRIVVAVAETAVGSSVFEVNLGIPVGDLIWTVTARRADSLPSPDKPWSEYRFVPRCTDAAPPPLSVIRATFFLTLGVPHDELYAVAYNDGVLRVEVAAPGSGHSRVPDQIDFAGEQWVRLDDEFENTASIFSVVQRFAAIYGKTGTQQLLQWIHHQETAPPLADPPKMEPAPPDPADSASPTAPVRDVPAAIAEAIFAGDFVDESDLESPDGRAFFRKLPLDVARRWLNRNVSRIHRPYDLWRHARMRHQWSLVDPTLASPSPRSVQRALVSYLAHTAPDERDVRVAEGLRRQGFRIDQEPISHPVLKLPTELVREVCSMMPRDAILRLMTTLKHVVDPDARLTAVLAGLQQGLADHDLTQQEGPALSLVHWLYDLGAGTDVWLLAGGRMVAGLGRLCYRYPAIRATISEVISEVDGQWNPTSEVDKTFRAAAFGDEKQAAESIAYVDRLFAAAGLGPWPIGRLILADLAQRRGDDTAARRFAAEAASNHGNWPETLLWYADLESANGDDAKALALLEPLRNHPTVRPRLGRLHFRLGQLQQARSLGFTGHRIVETPAQADSTTPDPPLTIHDVDSLFLPPVATSLDRQIKLWLALGYGELAVATLVHRFESKSADEECVWRLCEMTQGPFAHLIHVDKRRLAEQALLATGAALPGAGGYQAARSLLIAEALLRQVGDLTRADTLAMIHRDVLDRTVEQGVRAPWLTVAWLEWLESRLAAGHPEAWEQRRGLCLRNLRETPIQEVAVLTTAGKLYRQLVQYHAESARFLADGLLAGLPDSAGALQSGDQDTAQAVIELLRVILADDHAEDERLKHAPDLRVTAALEHVATHRWDAALSAGVALCNRELLPTYRYQAVKVQLAALAMINDFAASPMIRKGWTRAEEGPDEVAWPTWRAFLTTDDPRLLGPAWGIIETLPKKRTIGIREAASIADLFGHMVATVVAELPWTGHKVPMWSFWDTFPGRAYWLARALVSGTYTLSRLVSATNFPAAAAFPDPPDWTEVLVDAVKLVKVDYKGVLGVNKDWDGVLRGWPASGADVASALFRLAAALPPAPSGELFLASMVGAIKGA